MGQDGSGLAVMDHRRRHRAQTRVVMLVVVPVKEGLTEPASIFDGAERSGKPGRYFKVRNWLSEYGLSSETCATTVGLDHTQIGQQQSHRFGFHR